MSEKRKHRRDLLIVLIPVVLSHALGLALLRGAINEDARREREAALDLCEESNAQVALIRSVLVAALRPPPVESYSYIEDPEHRQAAYDQTVQIRADLRADIEAGLVAKNCREITPEPPS